MNKGNGKRSNQKHCLLGLARVWGHRQHQLGLEFTETLTPHRTAISAYSFLLFGCFEGETLKCEKSTLPSPADVS